MDAAEAPDPRADPTRRTTTHFFALNALIAVALCVPFVRGHPLSGASLLYQLALLATYPLLYLTPAWLLAHLARWTGRLAGLGSAAVAPVAILGVLATDALLILDSNVHRLYGFHLNGFVWNLVTAAWPRWG